MSRILWILFLSVCCEAYGQQCVTCTSTNSINNGLIFCATFDSSGCKDAAAGGFACTEFNNPVWGVDHKGNAGGAVSFDGSTSYLRYGDILDSVFAKSPAASFSISGWAKTNALSLVQGDNVIMGKSSGGSSGPYQWYIVHENDGKVAGLVSYALAASTNFLELKSINPVPANTWFHFVMTYDGSSGVESSKLKFYVNTVLGSISRNVGSGGSTLNNTNQEMTVGGTYDPGTNLPVNVYDGFVDEIRIYNRVLTQAEINVLYNDNPVTLTPLSDELICKGDSVQLSASGGTSYSWTPSTYLDNALVSNPKCKAPVKTTYVLQVTAGMCFAYDTIVVNVDSVIASAGSDKTICKGDSFNFSASGGTAYTWNTSFELSDSTIYNPLCKASSSRPYFVKVSKTLINSKVCVAYDTVQVTVNTITPDAGLDNTLCPGDSVQLNGSGGVTYNWDPNPTLSSTNIPNPYAKPTVTTTYFLTVTDGPCTAKDSVTISIGSSITTDAGVDQQICFGDSVQLNGTGGSTFVWTPSLGLNNANISNPKASPGTTTDYILTSSSGLCSDQDTVRVTVNPLPSVDAGNNFYVCEQSPSALNPVVSGADQYSWEPPAYLDNPTVLNPYARIQTPTWFKLTATNSVTGCAVVDSVRLIISKPVAQFSASPLSGSTPLEVKTDNTSIPANALWDWDFGDTTNHEYSFEPTHTYLSMGNFVVRLIVTDSIGCKDTAYSAAISTSDKLLVFIPNAITPDDDNLNDNFQIIYTKGMLKNMHGTIWNRWGEKIYEFNYPTDPWWDGKVKGKTVSEGVFIYSIEATDINGKVSTFKGTVTVLR